VLRPINQEKYIQSGQPIQHAPIMVQSEFARLTACYSPFPNRNNEGCQGRKGSTRLHMITSGPKERGFLLRSLPKISLEVGWLSLAHTLLKWAAGFLFFQKFPVYNFLRSTYR